MSSFTWALTEDIDQAIPHLPCMTVSRGGKLEGDFGSKLEGDDDCFEWALTADIDQAILHLPSMTVSNGGGGKLEGDFGSILEGDSGLGVNLKVTLVWLKLEGDGDCFKWALTEHIDM